MGFETQTDLVGQQLHVISWKTKQEDFLISFSEMVFVCNEKDDKRRGSMENVSEGQESLYSEYEVWGDSFQVEMSDRQLKDLGLLIRRKDKEMAHEWKREGQGLN